MTTAILEIAALLLVAGLIGVFFTRRYWKHLMDVQTGAYEEKLKAQEAKLDQLRQEMNTAKTEATEQQAKIEALEKDLASRKKTAVKKEIKADEDMVTREELEAHVRELEVLNKELANGNGSYYKQIDGKRYKALTLKIADEAIEGQGDGRISMQDAEKVFETISDGLAYTPVEKNTMHYLRENYNWTPEANELFRTKVRSWAAKGHHLD